MLVARSNANTVRTWSLTLSLWTGSGDQDSGFEAAWEFKLELPEAEGPQDGHTEDAVSHIQALTLHCDGAICEVHSGELLNPVTTTKKS